MKLVIVEEHDYGEGEFGKQVIRPGPERVICSDTHIGHGLFGDDFDKEAFWYFLSHVVRVPRRLWVAGDFVENWEEGPNPFVVHYEIIDWVFRKLLAELIEGNHEGWFKRIGNRFLPERREQDGVLALHGHQADVFNYELSFLGRIATLVNGVCERIFNRGLDEIGKEDKQLQKLPSPAKMTDNAYLDVEDKYVYYVSEQVDRANAFIGVFGHTHRPGVWQKGITEWTPFGEKPRWVPKWIVNCGSFVKDRPPTFVRLKKKGFELCRIER